MISSGGAPNPRAWNRAFWAALEGALAAVLLLAGGLAALQTMSILVALPSSIVMVLMVVATFKALGGEVRQLADRRREDFRVSIVEQVSDDLAAERDLGPVKSPTGAGPFRRRR